ncbi:MAG: tryptophan synthase subunit alpha [Defluviitaleaceae bacterium]|nr:tryptophan synthase subunit alpha [Defluviitaleaceae bacterium]
MNNRISDTFAALKNNGKKALIAFITGGDPDIEVTEKLILAMGEAGVDIIEIGIPFSDPIAEGPVIEAAAARALGGGCTIDKLFDMVENVRNKTNIPLLFMTYANPIYAYGKERFMAKCRAVGIDGIIVPDVPYEEKSEFEDECNRHNIYQIPLIAPTSGARAEKIAREAKGFIYCVSSLGVTGIRNDINTDIAELIKRVNSISSVPCAVGFGISTPEQARDMAKISDGVIIGSAIVDLVARHGEGSIESVRKFVSEIKSSI